jgi:macrodomain Ter protein organizer (MatP/YcbG family)
MKAKLTLSIDQDKIKKIKRYSKKNGHSVSKFIEDFIDNVDKKDAVEKFDITKVIGAFGKVSKNFDADKVKWQYLKKKHGL